MSMQEALMRELPTGTHPIVVVAMLGLAPSTLIFHDVNKMPERLLQRIGFQVYGSLGNIDPAPDQQGLLVDPGKPRVGRRSVP